MRGAEITQARPRVIEATLPRGYVKRSFKLPRWKEPCSWHLACTIYSKPCDSRNRESLCNRGLVSDGRRDKWCYRNWASGWESRLGGPIGNSGLALLIKAST